jgi:uncharacterized repeat protein (TIGR01451 family)
VKALTRPPQTPVRPRAVAEAPRRWPKRLAAAVIAVVLLCAVAVVLWANRIDPLARGSVPYRITDPALHATVRTIDALGVSGTVQTVQTRPGQTFTYRFSIRNDGRVPVQIVGVGNDTAHGSIVTRRAVRMQPDLFADPNPNTGFEAFAPFTLASGDEAAIEMLVTVGNNACFHTPGQPYLGWYLESVEYKVLGITRQEWLDSGSEIRVTSAPGACTNQP